MMIAWINPNKRILRLRVGDSPCWPDVFYDWGESGLFPAAGLTSISCGSWVAILKFWMPRPIAPPISGSLPTPKTIRMITMMTAIQAFLFRTWFLPSFKNFISLFFTAISNGTIRVRSRLRFEVTVSGFRYADPPSRAPKLPSGKLGCSPRVGPN